MKIQMFWDRESGNLLGLVSSRPGRVIPCINTDPEDGWIVDPQSFVRDMEWAVSESVEVWADEFERAELMWELEVEDE